MSIGSYELNRMALDPSTVDFTTSNGRSVAAFDGSTNEDLIFEFIMPQAYASGTLTLYAKCWMASAVSGDVDLDAAVEALTPGANEDVTSDSYDTANSSDNNSVPGTAGDLFEISITLTNKDSVAAGDLVRVKLTRDASSDTATGDLYIGGVEIRES